MASHLLEEVRRVFQHACGHTHEDSRHTVPRMHSPSQWTRFVAALSSHGLLQLGEGDILQRRVPSQLLRPDDPLLDFDACMDSLLDTAEELQWGVTEEVAHTQEAFFTRASHLLQEAVGQAHVLQQQNKHMVGDAPGGMSIARRREDLLEEVEGFLGLLSETRCFVQEECMRAVQGAVIHLGEHQGGEACRSLFLDQLDASALESEEEEELTPDRFFEENKQVIRRLLETHQIGELSYAKDPRRWLDTMPVEVYKLTGFHRTPEEEQRIRVICVPLCPEDGQDILQVEHNLTQVDAWKEVVAFPALGVNAVPLSSKGGSCGY